MQQVAHRPVQVAICHSQHDQPARSAQHGTVHSHGIDTTHCLRPISISWYSSDRQLTQICIVAFKQLGPATTSTPGYVVAVVLAPYVPYGERAYARVYL